MSCPLSVELHQWVHAHLFSPPVIAWATSAGTTFAVIAAAEIGDKSQLVCMSLAARHRHWPVFLGAFAAFGLLNLLAVLFGAAVAHWLPKLWLSLAVAALFGVFGVTALFAADRPPDQDVTEKSGHGVFVTTFLMIFLAEFGDKTQLATAGLGTAAEPVPVWVGATAALSLTSALGVAAGRTLLQRIRLRLLHRISGLLFIALAAYVIWDLLSFEQLKGWLDTLLQLWWIGPLAGHR